MSWGDILAGAAKETDESFASKISSLCRLTDEEIASIAPTKDDKERLTELITIVKNTTVAIEQKAEAIKKIDNSVHILIGIVSKFI